MSDEPSNKEIKDAISTMKQLDREREVEMMYNLITKQACKDSMTRMSKEKDTAIENGLKHVRAASTMSYGGDQKKELDSAIHYLTMGE